MNGGLLTRVLVDPLEFEREGDTLVTPPEGLLAGGCQAERLLQRNQSCWGGQASSHEADLGSCVNERLDLRMTFRGKSSHSPDVQGIVEHSRGTHDENVQLGRITNELVVGGSGQT